MPLEQLRDTNSSQAIAPHWSSSYPDYLSPVWDEGTQRAVVWNRLREHRKLANRSLQKINKRYKALRQEQQTQVESRHESSSRDNYLVGSPHNIVIHTDHSNLQYWKEARKISRRIAREFLDLSEYDFVIKHIPGVSNVRADALS